MRSRTLREGSIGLLIIFGFLVFGAFALWLKGFAFGAKSYKIVADFPDVNGITMGDGVRYRGLQVGRVVDIRPNANGVDVIVEVDNTDLLIPHDAILKAQSSGLIGETFVEIVPKSNLPSQVATMSPIGANCDPDKIVCNNARLRGEKGITLDDLLPFTYRFSKAYGEPEFVAKVDSAVGNAADAASAVADLTRDTSLLVGNLQKEVNDTSKELVATASAFKTTASTFNTTAEQINRLTSNVEQLIVKNEANLNTTLDSFSTTSERLQDLVTKLEKTIDTADTEQLANNLNQLTADASIAVNNLKNISESLGSQEGVVTLQQTLDSARVTFDNVQKITSDLESITGDPSFLENVQELVDGLSNLVSTSEQLEQQILARQIVKPTP